MKVTILGKIVEYNEDARTGIDYLIHRIESHEAKVFFDQAFSKGVAHFETQMGTNYKLVRESGEYRLEKL